MEPPITQLLDAASTGGVEALERLFSVVYTDLEALARARLRRLRAGDSLRTGDLVHESYLRLVGGDGVSWANRRHFFGAASRAMRDILVDEARRRRSQKRGGGAQRWELGDDLAAADARPVDLLALDEALEKLERESEVQHQIVMFRYFGGLTIDDVAKLLEVSPSSVDRHWKFARAWLLRELCAS